MEEIAAMRKSLSITSPTTESLTVSSGCQDGLAHVDKLSRSPEEMNFPDKADVVNGTIQMQASLYKRY